MSKPRKKKRQSLVSRVRVKVRGQFEIEKDLIPLNAMLVASPPKVVRRAIERHRAGLNADPAGYLLIEHPNNGPWNRFTERPLHVADRAATYLGLRGYLKSNKLLGKDVIAQTSSTTMGLGLLANGIHARPGQEVLMTEHDFFSWQESWQIRCQRTGLGFRQIRLYKDGSYAAAAAVQAVASEIRDNTRVVALTWVHSHTGVKLPIDQIGEVIRQVNGNRKPDD